ncbi:putative CopG family antitoxin [Mycoplana sp. BE70]|nr:putative CopG family antitoxin [Mycoplana sp. BE70]
MMRGTMQTASVSEVIRQLITEKKTLCGQRSQGA